MTDSQLIMILVIGTIGGKVLAEMFPLCALWGCGQ